MKATVAGIQAAVAKQYDIAVEDMVSKSRARPVANPRQVAMYLVRKLMLMSYPNIGRHFGGRDHTTVMYGIQEVERRLTTERKTQRIVAKIERQFEPVEPKLPTPPKEKPQMRLDLWLASEIDTLRDMAAEGCSGKEIARELGRTDCAVRNKAHYLGIHLRRKGGVKGWSRRPEEEYRHYVEDARRGSAMLLDAILKAQAVPQGCALMEAA